MLINVIYPSGLSSGRELFNYDWITLGVMGVTVEAGKARTEAAEARIEAGVRCAARTAVLTTAH